MSKYDTAYLNVEPKICESSTNHKNLGSNSNCHYGWHSGGYPKSHAMSTAREIVQRYQEANCTRDCAKYPVISLAIIPYPGKNGFYYVEDRSECITYTQQCRG